jgi:gamma-glutamyl phosphate reductase
MSPNSVSSANASQRFDDQNKSINQRFDAQDRRIEDLVKGVSELRKLSDRVTRNETRIDTIKEQLQAADAPAP